MRYVHEPVTCCRRNCKSAARNNHEVALHGRDMNPGLCVGGTGHEHKFDGKPDHVVKHTDRANSANTVQVFHARRSKKSRQRRRSKRTLCIDTRDTKTIKELYLVYLAAIQIPGVKSVTVSDFILCTKP
ncbi:hypothetical protein J6590_059182 [Homalodisca vitripennis]|nr:hypothetical protein J6590_059182 [Homalodisca vitripennis]